MAAAPKYLSPVSSFLLDAIRLLAALCVAFTHARATWFREKEYDFIPGHLAHGSVIIFFVLSGYVIAYTTAINKRTAKEYAVARLSRLYSVVLPALLFTVLVSVVLFYHKPGLLNAYARNNDFWRYIISLFFCNEIWFLSAAPLLNGVIWSLSYEFWFYTIFGSWLYKTNKKEWLLLVLFILIAGPKILLMMPIWVLGVFAYRLPKLPVTFINRFVLIALSLMIAVALMLTLPQMPYTLNTSKLYWASPFISDYITAVFIAFAFWLLPLTPLPALAGAKMSAFRKIADLTFPIYMFHFPCLVLIKSFLNTRYISYTTMYLALSITLVFCFVIGIYTEKWHAGSKHLFRKLFLWQPVKSFLSIKNRLLSE
jgi:peptidoglycan/LPS O-acetylase OafA/YrhL